MSYSSILQLGVLLQFAKENEGAEKLVILKVAKKLIEETPELREICEMMKHTTLDTINEEISALEG